VAAAAGAKAPPAGLRSAPRRHLSRLAPLLHGFVRRRGVICRGWRRSYTASFGAAALSVAAGAAPTRLRSALRSAPRRHLSRLAPLLHGFVQRRGVICRGWRRSYTASFGAAASSVAAAAAPTPLRSALRSAPRRHLSRLAPLLHGFVQRFVRRCGVICRGWRRSCRASFSAAASSVAAGAAPTRLRSALRSAPRSDSAL